MKRDRLLSGASTLVKTPGRSVTLFRPSDIGAAADALAAEIRGEPVDVATLTQPVIEAARIIDTLLAARLDGSIDGGQFADRGLDALGKAKDLMASPDGKQARVARAAVAGLSKSRAGDRPAPDVFADFIERVEEQKPQRQVARKQPRRGRMKGSGKLEALDVKLVTAFHAERGHWPTTGAEWESLAAKTPSTGTIGNAVKRMQASTRKLRATRNFNSPPKLIP